MAETGEPLEIDNVTVQPDDLIVADTTGIIVSADDLKAVAKIAEETLGEEILVEKKIANSTTVSNLQRDDHEF